jgi:hypothetical protein
MFCGYKRLHNLVDAQALIDQQYKILKRAVPPGKIVYSFIPGLEDQVFIKDEDDYIEEELYELYDLKNDPGETNNLKDQMPQLFEKMKEQMKQIDRSCQMSRDGSEYSY